MAQNIKLKRSSVAGKVPTAAQLEAGEIAINTADGKLYFERGDSTIQTIVTTNAVITGSLNINGPVTASFFKGDGSAITGIISSSYSTTASYVNPLTQDVVITRGLVVGATSAGSNENTLVLGPPPAGGSGEGGQLLLQAAGGTYTSASMLDNYQDQTRLLRGTNAGSDGLVASWNMHTKQMQLPAYNSTSSFPGTAIGVLGFDSSGNILTATGSGASLSGGTANYLARWSSTTALTTGSVYDNGTNVAVGGISPSYKLDVTGDIRATGAVYANVNGAMYFRGGDDVELWDINISNHLGIYGQQDQGTAIIKLGSGGGTVSGRSGSIGINTTTPTSASLTVNGNVWAKSFTGSLQGNASTATSASFATYTLSALSASYALTASHAANLTISGSISNVNYIDFNTGSATPAWKSGRVFWDNTDGALSVYNAEADSTLQVGQENWTRVYNASGVLIQDGTPVRLVGSHGDVPEIQLAQAIAVSGSIETSNQILGLATHDIEINTIGYVTTEGLVKGLNTNAFSDGDRLFVSSSAGKLTKVAPPAPYEVIPVGIVVKAGPGGSGIIYVTTEQPKDFADLSSVRVEGAYTHGDLLIYSGSGTGGVWRHTRNLIGAYQLTGSLGINGTLTGNLTGNASTATTASYALKAESVGQLNQNVVINGNLQVFGTSSFTYVTSSQLNVADSFISVNIFEPAERFGGLKVYDSGSLSHQATASLAWDSLHNHWVYQNVSGSTYTGGMLLAGPRNTGSLGDEPNLTKWFVPRSDGGDHLNDSQIFTSGSTTIITGSLTTTGKVNITTVDNFGSDPDKFLALTGTEVVYRTGAQLLSDIGGQTAGTSVQNAGSGGVARYIMRYEDSNSATTSSIYEAVTGNIGIRTTNPSAPLDVNGNTVVSGSLTVLGSTTAVGGVTGSLLGNAATATSASFAATAPFAGISGKPTLVSGSAQINLAQATGTAANATSASYAIFATSASFATYANSAGSATSAATATSASFASTAPFAGITEKPTLVSGSAQINLSQATGTAATATSASFATYANTAGSATSAATATSASFATYANTAGSATSAATATSASFATYANTAGSATSAATATSASFATYANSAGSATSAATATSASFATYANTAGSATSATNASNINISATTSADTVTSVVLVADQATGNQSPFIDSGLTYNANTNALTATTFVGALTGNADTATALTSGDKTITGNLTVTGKVTAEEFHTEFISSSIIFSSGSTKFGDDSNDVHSFTGSLNLNTLNNATTDTDRFIVSDGGTLKYRTGAEVLSDIGAQASGNYVTDDGGATGQVAIWSSATAMSGSNGLYWSGSNLGVNVINPQAKLHVSGTTDVLLIQGSGSTANTTVFAVDGNNGRLFEISDDLSDSLFSVNTIAGLPVMEAFADNTVTLGAYNQYDLHITGSKVGFGKSNPAYKVDVNGTVAATALVETSARKFKEGIEPVVDALNTVTQLQGVTFVRIGEENREYGFIADEVADVAPALVSYDENGNPYGIQYARTVAIQNEAIKELNDKVNSQELFIRDLLRRIEKLENK